MIRTPPKTRAKRDSEERERISGNRSRERSSTESERSYMEVLRMSPEPLFDSEEPQLSISEAVSIKKKAKSVNKVPIVLPATAADVKDFDTLDKTITSLVTAICVAISEGKCVTKRNKMIVASAATEIRRSFDTYIFEKVNIISTPTTTPPHHHTDTTTTDKNIQSSTSSYNIDIKEQLKSFSENIQDKIADCVRKEIAIIKQDLKILPSIQTHLSEPTYAQVAAIRAQTKPKSRPSILVTPKIASKSKTELINKWQNNVSFTETNYAPNKVVPLTSNKLLVEFDNTQHRDDTLKKLENSEALNVKLPTKLKPMLILKGINKHTEKTKLLNIIYSQNPEFKENNIGKEEIQIKFTTQNKNLALYNTILMVSPEVFEICINKKRINIDHQKIHVSEHIPLLQCFKCLQFGHTTKHCRNTEQNCSHCAARDHTYRACVHKNDPSKTVCLNCKSHNTKYNLKIILCTPLHQHCALVK